MPLRAALGKKSTGGILLLLLSLLHILVFLLGQAGSVPADLHWSWFLSLPSLLILCVFLFKSKGTAVLHGFPKNEITLKYFPLGKHLSEFGSGHAGFAVISGCEQDHCKCCLLDHDQTPQNFLRLNPILFTSLKLSLFTEHYSSVSLQNLWEFQ